ncbi:MAG: acetate/propionate family kinase [Polyangiaceae bacterium]|nr:acetate/propionate family kinase [Polyangiaceae bacterium]
MRVLLLNAGSSSLKCTLMDAASGTVLVHASTDWAGSVARYERVGPASERLSTDVGFRSHGDAVRYMITDLGVGTGPDRPDAVGHRIVHGGEFRSSVQITRAVRGRIAELAALAPLHNPPSLEALTAAESLLPMAPHIAVFDTAFHATMPRHASTLPVPRTWSDDFGIRRYGFHGLSHAYCARRAAELLLLPIGQVRSVICHLGHGCSATAVDGGESMDTTMGFTPLDGLMMETRSGSVDPGAVVHVQRTHGLTPQDVEAALNHRSGLLGVSGVSADMREVMAAAREQNDRARLAIEIYVHRVRQAIGALAVTLGGIEALVFTAGVGENSAEIRSMTCRGLECLGVHLDQDANTSAVPDADVAVRGARVRVLVIRTREDLAMLSEVVRVVAY